MINFLQPKWKHPEKTVRLAAIGELDPQQDLELIIEIINSDNDRDVLTATIDKMRNVDALESILQSASSRSNLVVLIQNKLNRLYFDRVVLSNSNIDIDDVLMKISDEKILEEIVNRVDSIDLKKLAVSKISDNAILSRLTESKCGKIIGCIAVDRVFDENYLNRIASHASNKHVRTYALKKVDQLTHKEPELSESEKRELKLKELSNSANRLAVSWNWEYAAKTFKQNKLDWEALDTNNEHYLKSNFDQLYSQFFERYDAFKIKQREIEKNLEEINKIINYHKDICSGIASLQYSNDDQSDIKFNNYKSNWTVLPDNDDFKGLIELYERECSAYEERKHQILEDTEKRQQLETQLSEICSQVEKLVEFVDLAEAESCLKRWNKDWTDLYDNDDDSMIDLHDRFLQALDTFEKRKEHYLSEIDRREKNFIQKLNELCKSIEQFSAADGTDLIKSEKQVKATQREWDEIKWPEPDKNKEFINLRKRFKGVCDCYYEKLRDCREKDGWEKWSNLTAKEELCKAVEKLEAEADVYKISKQIKEYHKKWKTIGRVPFEKADYINNRFKTCSDVIYKRCNLFFTHIEEDRQKNLQLKREINSEISAYIDSSATWKAADKVKKLQKKWWEAGAVPKGEKDDLEKLFKSNCDVFFTKHKNYLEQLSKQHDDNAGKKELLCIKAESLQTIDNWQAAIDTVKKLQKEWKHTGPASVKQEKKLWNRFNKSLNEFFSEAAKNSPQNLTDKKALAEELSDRLKDVKTDADITKDNIKKLTDEVRCIQKKWKSIGPVPENEEESINELFQNFCDSFYDIRRIFLRKSKDYQKKQLSTKKTMLDEIRNLAADTTDWKRSSAKVKKLMKSWTVIGELNLVDSRQTDKQFQHFYNLFFEKEKIHSGKIDNKQLTNLKSKEELCYRMELLADSDRKTGTQNDDSSLSLSKQLEIAFESNFISASKQAGTQEQNWHNSLAEVKKIQTEWEKIGACPAESEYSLNQRLKKAEDKFFSKRPRVKRIDDPAVLKANLIEKTKICETIEELSKKEDLPSVLNVAKKWQKKWKDTGPVSSKRESDSLWQRYHSACDIIYSAVRETRENSY